MRFLKLLFILVLLLSGCNQEKPSSPSESTKAFFEYAFNGNYSKMKIHMNKQLLEIVEESYGMEEYVNDVTDNGSIRSISIIKEVIEGNRATVHYLAKMKNGKEEEQKTYLIREDDLWKFKFIQLNEIKEFPK